MNFDKILKNVKFLKKDQFERRRILENYILSDRDCKIGTHVLCFEKEIICDKRFFYNKSNNHKLVELTVGKKYLILDHKPGKIKIVNDGGSKVWCTINRFLYSLQKERLEKLKKLNQCQL